MELTLQNKVAVVTGASSGIGQAIAIALSNAGAITYAIARHMEGLCITKEKAQGILIPLVATMTEESGVKKAYETIHQEHKKIDIWVNNLGQNKVFGNTWDIESTDWLYEFNVNFKSAVIGSMYALKDMVKDDDGTVVNIAGGGVSNVSPFSSSYSCSKTAIVRYTENVSAELKQIGSHVKVYSMNPGLVLTPHTMSLAQSQNGQKYYPNLTSIIEDPSITTSLSDVGQVVCDIANNKYDFMEGRLILAKTELSALQKDKKNILEKNRYTLGIL